MTDKENKKMNDLEEACRVASSALELCRQHMRDKGDLSLWNNLSAPKMLADVINGKPEPEMMICPKKCSVERHNEPHKRDAGCSISPDCIPYVPEAVKPVIDNSNIITIDGHKYIKVKRDEKHRCENCDIDGTEFCGRYNCTGIIFESEWKSRPIPYCVDCLHYSVGNTCVCPKCFYGNLFVEKLKPSTEKLAVELPEEIGGLEQYDWQNTMLFRGRYNQLIRYLKAEKAGEQNGKN